MTLEELKGKLIGLGNEDTVLFENPDYADAFLGLDSNGRAVYSYSKMVENLAESESMTLDDAIDFIDYNTLRALPYAGEVAPIVVFDDWE